MSKENIKYRYPLNLNDGAETILKMYQLVDCCRQGQSYLLPELYSSHYFAKARCR